MGVTVQVRDLDPAVNDRLKAAAAAKGLSYSEYLRRQLTRIAERLRIEERWAEVAVEHHALSERQGSNAAPRRRPLDITTEEIVHGIRDDRQSR